MQIIWFGNAPIGSDARFAFECRLFPRCVFLELRQFRIHRVPWLRVGRPNIVLRFVQTRIIQSPGCDALSEIALAPKQSRTAFRTKTAHIVAHHFAGCAEVFWRALGNFECVCGDVKNRSVRSAGCFLAIAAVTIERYNWFRGNFITNRAAGAPTGNWFHFVTLKLVKIFPEQLLDNPLSRNALGCPISLCRSRFRLKRFRFAIPRRRIGD